MRKGDKEGEKVILSQYQKGKHSGFKPQHYGSAKQPLKKFVDIWPQETQQQSFNEFIAAWIKETKQLLNSQHITELTGEQLADILGKNLERLQQANENDLGASKIEIINLKREKEEIEREKEEIEREKGELEREKGELERALKDLQAANGRNLVELEKAFLEEKENRGIIKKLTQEINGLNSRINGREEENAGYQNQINQLKQQEIDGLNSRINGLKEENAGYQNQINQLKQQHKININNLNIADQQIANLNQKLDQGNHNIINSIYQKQEHRISELEKQNEKLQKDNKILEKDKVQLEKQKQRIKNEKARADDDNVQLKRQINQQIRRRKKNFIKKNITQIVTYILAIFTFLYQLEFIWQSFRTYFGLATVFGFLVLIVLRVDQIVEEYRNRQDREDRGSQTDPYPNYQQNNPQVILDSDQSVLSQQQQSQHQFGRRVL